MRQQKSSLRGCIGNLSSIGPRAVMSPVLILQSFDGDSTGINGGALTEPSANTKKQKRNVSVEILPGASCELNQIELKNRRSNFLNM